MCVHKNIRISKFSFLVNLVVFVSSLNFTMPRCRHPTSQVASKEYDMSDIEVPLLAVCNWGGIW
jgi:hypothetical protein